MVEVAGEPFLADVLPRSLQAVRRGRILVVTLARPEKRNAIDIPTVEGLAAIFGVVPEDARAVVLHGQGAHFCAGLDLSEAADTPDLMTGVEHSQSWHRAFHAIQYARVPVVVMLHGAVVGGGLEMAAAAHIRVAERSAYYGLPEGTRGIFLGGGGTVRLTRLIGTAAVQDLMLTGRTLSAEEGQAMRLSQYLTEPGQGLAKAMALAERIAANSPVSNWAVIHAMPRIADADPGMGYFTESLMASIAQNTPEAKERLKDFLEKRSGKVLPGRS